MSRDRHTAALVAAFARPTRRWNEWDDADHLAWARAQAAEGIRYSIRAGRLSGLLANHLEALDDWAPLVERIVADHASHPGGAQAVTLGSTGDWLRDHHDELVGRPGPPAVPTRSAPEPPVCPDPPSRLRLTESREAPGPGGGT